MQRVKRSSAVASLPTAPVGGTPGYFANPNPAGGIAATVPGFEWFNSVQEELCGVISAAGITLDVDDPGQLLEALRSPGVFVTQSASDSSTKAATTAFANPASNLGASGYVKLPCGLILQWGRFTEGGTPLAAGSFLARIQSLPIAFPSSGFQVISSSYLNFLHCGSSLISNSQVQHYFSSNHTSALNLDAAWFAIGI